MTLPLSLTDRAGRRARHTGTALLLAGLALVAGCGEESPGTTAGSGTAAQVAPSATGADAPAFTAATLDGAEFDSAARFAQGPTVLWFWAPWCTICRTEAPEVLAVAEEFAGDVTVVGVAGRGEVDEMVDFVADTGTGRLEHVVDRDGAIWSEFGVVAQPAFAFVGRDGQVEVFNGALPPDDLRAAARSLAEG
ncbi:MAG: redoxin domain-containing protein [Actinomycetota bacterium]|nr:redoxin domain-containing protein [Actinomycetota bacterium]